MKCNKCKNKTVGELLKELEEAKQTRIERCKHKHLVQHLEYWESGTARGCLDCGLYVEGRYVRGQYGPLNVDDEWQLIKSVENIFNHLPEGRVRYEWPDEDLIDAAGVI